MEEGNDLNFSDIDSDDEDRNLPPKPVIAHKNLSAFDNITETDEVKNTSENTSLADVSEGVESKDPVKNLKQDNEIAFEPISPMSDSGDKLNSPTQPDSPSPNQTKTNFENISDGEEASSHDTTTDIIETKKDNILHSDNENSKDSRLQVNNSLSSSVIDSESSEKNGNESKSVEKLITGDNDDDGDDDVEAPMPSPFSDIGDVEEIGTGTDNELISDIMKESRDSEFGVVNKDAAYESLPINGEGSSIEKLQTEDDKTENDKTDITEEKVTEENITENNTEDGSIGVTSPHEVDAQSNVGESESKSEPQPDTTGDGENEEGGENLIADIFGDSDEEEEEFQGFDDAEIGDDSKELEDRQEVAHDARDEESSDDEMPEGQQSFQSDFDKMMEEKKRQKAKRRNRKDFDLVNDSDDQIAEMIAKMRECAEEDKMLNQCGKAATKKLKMLQTVITHLRKADLQHAFIDSGILPAMKEWLTPLPDHALPHVNIRKLFLKMLLEFPAIDRGALKVSGIGRAVMLLYKHPKEISDNKKMAGKIISNWARPIFNVSTNFQDISREEREDRDKKNLPEAKRRRLSSGADSNRNRLDDEEENRPRKPGDKGWIGRARVPMPSHRDYVNRPESKVESFDARAAKRQLNRYEKQARKMKDKRHTGGGNKKAVAISLNGSKLTL